LYSDLVLASRVFIWLVCLFFVSPFETITAAYLVQIDGLALRDAIVRPWSLARGWFSLRKSQWLGGEFSSGDQFTVFLNMSIV